MNRKNLMHTQLFESAVTHYNRDRRRVWLKRAFAWAGIVAAGSLLMFCAGGVAIHYFGLSAVLLQVAIWALLFWGWWGFAFIKNRR
jgi:hypothetical protein